MSQTNPALCPLCHAPVTSGAYFCPNCGKPLQEKPITTAQQFIAYAVSLLLPPLGLWYAFKYFQRSDAVSKRTAWIATILTIASTIIGIWYTIEIFGAIFQSLGALTSVVAPQP